MRPTLLLCSILCASLAVARAAPAARQRVVLADADPELRHAMEQALAPWHLEIVIDGAAPRDAASAQERADADTARFVVWRDGDQLVVFDRELSALERRASRAGRLDPVAAAAAALTIKTSMRLPPPPDAAPATTVAVSPAPGPGIRIEAGIAARLAGGDAAALSARARVAVDVRPWPAHGWRLGVAGDVGTSTPVSRASFKGTWQDWAVLGVAGWSYARAAWELEPQLGVGVRFSILDGREANAARSEADSLVTLRGGLAARWRAGRWAVGAELAIDATLNTPTYHRADTPAEVFQVPALGGLLGAQLAIEL